MAESCRSTEFLESDVVTDMHLNFLQDEKARQSLAVYPDTCMYGRLRNSIVVWMIETCNFLELTNATVFTAVAVLDRFMMLPQHADPPQQSLYQLYAMSAIFIGAKFEEMETNIPSLGRLNASSEYAFTEKAIEAMERQMLVSLSWKVAYVTPFSYARYYLHRTKTGQENTDHQLHRLVMQLLGLVLQDTQMQGWLPSQVCAAAVLCARAILEYNDVAFPAPPPEMQGLCGWTNSELHDCHQAILLLFYRFQQGAHAAAAAGPAAAASRGGVPAGKNPDASASFSDQGVTDAEMTLVEGDPNGSALCPVSPVQVVAEADDDLDMDLGDS